MARRFLDDESKQALTDAVRRIEAGSDVEVVLALRRRSGSYLAASLIAAAIVAYAVLAFLMLSPWPFAHLAFLIEPPLAGLLAGLAASRWPALLRVLSRGKQRRAQVETAAHATFHEKEVGLTHRRTGLLVYVSLLERQVAVIADRAVLDAVDAPSWRNKLAELERAVWRARSGAALAEAIGALAEPLAKALPRTATDENELPDEVDIA